MRLAKYTAPAMLAVLVSTANAQMPIIVISGHDGKPPRSSGLVRDFIRLDLLGERKAAVRAPYGHAHPSMVCTALAT